MKTWHGRAVWLLGWSLHRSCLFFALGLFALTVPCFGQSTFAFQNFTSGLLDAPVFDAQGTRLSGTNFLAVLYGGNSVETLSLAAHGGGEPMPGVPLTYSPGGLSGYFRDPAFVVVPAVLAGLPAQLQVRAWDARLGSTYEIVRALGLGGYGESNIFQAAGGDPNGGVPGLPGLLLGLQSFNLRPYVPEPSSLSLLLLGAAGWCLRKKYRPEPRWRQ